MIITVDMSDVSLSLEDLALDVGETTEQATIRYGVAAARELAKVTNPRRSTASSRKKKAAATMRRVVEPMPARDFNKLAKMAKPRVKLEGQWIALDKRRLVESSQELWDVIERNRVAGKTKRLPPTERYICKQADFNRVVTSRAKLWGAAKGAWIGAGQDIAARQSGLDRINIGKNFLSWAQRHAAKGRGKKFGGGHNTEVHLTNLTTGSAKQEGLSRDAMEWAIHGARRQVWAYYNARFRKMRGMRRSIRR